MQRPLVKICGLTRMRDVRLCVDLGADLLGFIFHARSPRNADPDFVAGIRTGKAVKVGVFVSRTATEVVEIMDRCGLHAAQLHGGQDEAFCEQVGPDRVIKVFWPDAYASQSALLRDLERFEEVSSHFLFDAGTQGSGGTGRSFDFTKLQHLEIQTPWFLAGGIAPNTISAALELNPPGLDINSGVEQAPGIKDENKLRAVFDRLAQVP